MRITAFVTHRDDPRVARTLESLLAQSRPPDDILVADGDSGPPALERLMELARRHPVIRVERHPGRVADTRAGGLLSVHGDAVAFLDADEVAPPHWLATLVAPLESGEADFAGGPTRPLGPPRSRTEAHLNAFDAWFYAAVVPRDIAALPMGNSVWSAAVFRKIGSFDRRLSMGGEDYDLNLRALAAGFRGRFVPEAWVYHDQSHVDRWSMWMRRKHRYNVGAALAYLKNGVLGRRAARSARVTLGFPHPYEWPNLISKPLALVQAWFLWQGMKSTGAPASLATPAEAEEPRGR
jgi:GT2 family glycosyltransferase